jgi:hypothetical protein
LRDRLDWALRGPFPDDAAALGTVIEAVDEMQKGELIAMDLGPDKPTWTLRTPTTVAPESENGQKCSAQSLRSLAAAHCISISDSGIRPAHRRGPTDQLSERQLQYRIEVLPLGRELHRVASPINWREIARRRTPTKKAYTGGAP